MKPETTIERSDTIVPPAPDSRAIVQQRTPEMAARCPLCGVQILSIGRGGHVMAEDLHPVPMHKRGGSGEGYMLCDDCGVLAELPDDVVTC